jgi:hypothetical protein
MQLIVHIPDDVIEEVKGKLPPPQMGCWRASPLMRSWGF